MFKYQNPIVTDPQQVVDIRAKAPKAIDKEGRELLQFSGIWCSTSFSRFKELCEKMDKEDRIITLRVGDGAFYSKPVSTIRRALKTWKKKIETGYYCFIDPETQTVYM